MLKSAIRRTQLVLGIVLGFTFGYWLAGGFLGVVSAFFWLGIAWLRNSWLSMTCGLLCGLLIVPNFRQDLGNDFYPLYPILFVRSASCSAASWETTSGGFPTWMRRRTT